MDSERDQLLSFAVKPPRPKRISLARLQVLILTILLLDSFSGFLLDVPIVQLLEEAVCWRYSRDSDSTLSSPNGNDVCKSKAVQKEVAIIIGFKGTFDSIPSLLTAIRFGSLADKHSRKPILLLSFLGLYLHLLFILAVCINRDVIPTRMVWASSIFMFLGGGHKVFMSLIYTIVGDELPDDKSANMMFALNGMKMLSSALSPISSGFLMEKNSLRPFQVAIFLNTLCIVLICALPLPWSSSRKPDDKDVLDFGPSDHNPEEEDLEDRPGRPRRKVPINLLKSAFGLMFGPTIQAFPAIINNRNLFRLLFIMALHALAVSNTFILPQYASQRLGWSLSKAAKTMSIRYSVALVVTSILFPLASILAHRTFRRTRKWFHSRVLQLCIVVAVCGYVCLYVADTSPLYILGLLLCAVGEGSQPASLTLVALHTEKELRARTYTAIGLMEVLGVMLGKPSMAFLYSIGLGSNGMLAGVCFGASAVLLSSSVSLSRLSLS